MSKFIVNRQENAKRCEICHQKDYFDSFNNRCGRCDTLFLNKPLKEENALNISLLEWVIACENERSNHKLIKIFSYVSLTSWFSYCFGSGEVGLQLSLLFSFVGFLAILRSVLERKYIFQSILATIFAGTPLIFSIVYLLLAASQIPLGEDY